MREALVIHLMGRLIGVCVQWPVTHTRKKNLIKILLLIPGWLQAPLPSNLRVICSKLVGSTTNQTMFRHILRKHFGNVKAPKWVARSNFQCQRYLLCGTVCCCHQGTTPRNGITRELECSEAGGGPVSFAPLVPRSKVPLSEQQRTAGLQVRLQFG